MTSITFDDFQRGHRDVVEEVLRHLTPDMQELIARHNAGWRTGEYDFRNYLMRSAIRNFKAFEALSSHDPGVTTVCDVGGFWGVLAVTLARRGLDVTMTETLRYFSGAFDPLFDFVRSEGVRIHDYDPFSNDAGVIGSFDAVTIMALLEHYPHSLKAFMHNLRGLLAPHGMLFVDVPNIAYLHRRLQLLRGETPLPPIRHIFESRVPFTGHHHEFTVAELRELAELAGFEVVKEDAYNYSGSTLKLGSLPKSLLRGRADEVFLNLLPHMSFRFRPRTRECLCATWVLRA
jgi:2-polyprenyl-3-methyl-5-hydroxy-6-metoxy-1,4-benzoquinol methylase